MKELSQMSYIQSTYIALLVMKKLSMSGVLPSNTSCRRHKMILKAAEHKFLAGSNDFLKIQCKILTTVSNQNS